MSKVKTDSEGRLEPLISGVLSHVTLCIRDAVDSRKFYVDFLGLKELPRMPQPQPGAMPTPVPTPPVHATVQASVDGEPDLYDLAVVTILA